jgi:Ca2+-binding EF-hand superfamily protein
MPRPEAVERGLGMMLRNLPLMKALDIDEDGQLSPSEIENASRSLMKLDKNGDGVLSAEELRPEPGPALNAMANAMGPNGRLAPAAMARMFEMRDANGDGKLSGDEIPPPMRERLSAIDQNGDEAIDKAEAEAAMQRMQGRGMPNRPERGASGGQGVPPRRPQGDGN